MEFHPATHPADNPTGPAENGCADGVAAAMSAEAPARRLARIGALVAQCTAELGGLVDVTGSADADQLADLLAGLGELALAADAAEVAVVAEVNVRGTHRDGDWPLPLSDWVAAHSRRYACGAGAARVARVAQALTAATPMSQAGVLAAGQDGAVLGDVLRRAAAPVACVDVAIEQMRRLAPDLTPGAAPAVWAAFATVAASGDAREVRRLRPALYAKYGRPDQLVKDEATARAHAALSMPRTDVDGLSEYRWTLDGESVALLEAALDPLCAPQSGPDGEPDVRPAAKRRSDALMELLHRAITSAGPARPAGQLNLIVTAADLAAGSGCARTVGTLDAGRFLSVAAARRVACAADVTPVLLDEHGNPIVIGRTKRLFTRTQVKALLLRDEHCTFPGCTRPAGWADAHHLIHWIDGGPTDLDNAALLCTFHHHVVHSRRLAGQVNCEPPHQPSVKHRPAHQPSAQHPPPERAASGRARVRWDLSPGSYDRHLATTAVARAKPPAPKRC